MARETRARANVLTDPERERLMGKALSLIYDQKGAKRAHAHSR